MKIYIAPPSYGLGDMVLTLPVVQQLVERTQKLKKDEVWVITRARAQSELARLIPGVAGVIHEVDFNDEPQEGAHIVYDLRNHELQRNHWWGSLESHGAIPGKHINEILGRICQDQRLRVDLSGWEPLPFLQRSDTDRKIIFIPGSDVNFKCWPAHYWLELYEKLQAAGLEAVMLGQPGRSLACRSLIAMGIPWLPTATVGDALDTISSSLAVVAVDTGLMHLAVHQKVPTVALYRKDPVYLRRQAHVFPVIDSKRCEQVCYEKERACRYNDLESFGCDFKPPNWSCQAAIGSGCMERLTPERVLEAISHAQLFTTGQLHLPLFRS